MKSLENRVRKIFGSTHQFVSGEEITAVREYIVERLAHEGHGTDEFREICVQLKHLLDEARLQGTEAAGMKIREILEGRAVAVAFAFAFFTFQPYFEKERKGMWVSRSESEFLDFVVKAKLNARLNQLISESHGSP